MYSLTWMEVALATLVLGFDYISGPRGQIKFDILDNKLRLTCFFACFSMEFKFIYPCTGLYILAPTLVSFHNNFILKLERINNLGIFIADLPHNILRILQNFHQTVHKCRIFLTPFQLLSIAYCFSR